MKDGARSTQDLWLPSTTAVSIDLLSYELFNRSSMQPASANRHVCISQTIGSWNQAAPPTLVLLRFPRFSCFRTRITL